MKLKFRISALLLIFMLSVAALEAQTYRAEIGYINPRQTGKYFSPTNFNGVKLGATVEFDLKNNFSFLTGALYSVVYSNKVQYFGVSKDSVTYKTWGHFVDVPLHVQYALPLGKDFKLFAFAGPTFNIGIAQPQKIDAVFTTAETQSYVNIKSLSYAENDLYTMAKISRINFQLGAGAGVQWKNYQLKGGYDFGINSINKIDTSKQLRQSGWYVSLVYEF